MKTSRDRELSANGATRKRGKSTLLEYLRSMRPNEELARTLEKVLEKRKHIRLRMGSREPFLARRPVGRSVLRDLSAKHDEYLYGKKRSRVAKEASEETARRKTMLEAAEAADKLRETTSVRGWSGAREIRKWRDREKKP